MSLRETVAAPFRRQGRDRMSENDFVVDLSLKRDWFTPDQAKRVVDIAVREGLVERDGDELAAQFDPRETSIPEGFSPDESVLQQRSTFQRILAAVTESGLEKQEAVAGINRLQADLGLTVEAAGIVFARRQGIDVSTLAEDAIQEV